MKQESPLQEVLHSKLPPAGLLLVRYHHHPSQVLAPHDQEARMGPLAHQHGVPLQLLERLTGQATANTHSISSDYGPSSSGSSGVARAEAAEVEAIIADLADLSASDPRGALIIYTSGTTGRPKGALHTHR